MNHNYHHQELTRQHKMTMMYKLEAYCNSTIFCCIVINIVSRFTLCVVTEFSFGDNEMEVHDFMLGKTSNRMYTALYIGNMWSFPVETILQEKVLFF